MVPKEISIPHSYLISIPNIDAADIVPLLSQTDGQTHKTQITAKRWQMEQHFELIGIVKSLVSFRLFAPTFHPSPVPTLYHIVHESIVVVLC